MKVLFLILVVALCSCKKGSGWADYKCWKCEAASGFSKDTCNHLPYPPNSIDSSGILVTVQCQLK